MKCFTYYRFHNEYLSLQLLCYHYFMSKPKQIIIGEYPFYCWNYEGQTEIKHRVIASYSKIWFSKVGSKVSTIFFDCHGGCGAYIDANKVIHLGSSFLVIRSSQIRVERQNKMFAICCEIDKDNYDNLKKVYEYYNYSSIEFANSDFNDVITQSRIRNLFFSKACLVLVDPFGYNTKMANLWVMMKHWGSEVIVNFMYDFLSRFLSNKEDASNITNFFGCDEWKDALTMHGIEKEKFLADLYKKQLKKVTKAKFAFAYRICSCVADKTYYYLMHVTNSIQGMALMKSAFHGVCNRLEFLGKKNNQLSLFDLEDSKQSEIIDFLKKRFSHCSLSFNKIYESIVEDTYYLDRDVSKALIQMETNNEIIVERVESKRAIKGTDIINFL